jgi:hypothetical protein
MYLVQNSDFTARVQIGGIDARESNKKKKEKEGDYGFLRFAGVVRTSLRMRVS